MANLNGHLLKEGQSNTRPPWFDGINYGYWKNRMIDFLQSVDYQIWLVIVNGPFVPMKGFGAERVPKTKAEWNTEDYKLISLNAKAKVNLNCAISLSEYNRVSTCTTAKEIWDKLQVTYKGTSQVKESKIDILMHQYELFRMNENKSISAMFVRFTDIINGLKHLGRTMTNSDLARKILRSLPEKWDVKATEEIQQGKVQHDISTCFHYRKPGYFKADCHAYKEEKKKKRAMQATWEDDDSNGSESNEEKAILCLMASRDEVNSNSNSSSECEMSYDELVDTYNGLLDGFKELHDELVSTSSKHKWFLDSGCSRHMTGDRAKFSSLEAYNGGSVTFGDNSKGKDNLGKFDAKSDEGIFLGYSSRSKAYRVYNKRTLVVVESIHVVFDESSTSPTKSVMDNDEEVELEKSTNELDTIGPL
ncbi:uncharacterized protein LOC132270528 [Cornus florida]|uniref:uncharacterized protein LOC132270528 n=1 Tax=Cornus florida TaxID=4283 RepID=UPI00289CB42E|nr:uncharacterized protein LOC132270528 [Cornus florida]